MEKHTLIAVVLCLLILVLYQEWLGRRYSTPPPSPQAERKLKEEAHPAPRPRETQVRRPAPQSLKEIRVETDHYVATFTNRGARLKSLFLKHYRASADKKSPPLEMISSATGVPYPLGIQLNSPQPFNDEGLIYSVQGASLKLTGNGQGTLLFQARTPSGAELIKKFSFVGSSYPIGLEISLTGADASTAPALLLSSEGNPKGSAGDAAFEGFLALVGKKVLREPVEEIKKGKEITGPIRWVGFGYTYFLFSALPEGEEEQGVVVRQEGPALVAEIGGLSEATAEKKSRYTLFIGPKDLDVLKSLDKELERSLDFGYLGFISLPFLHALRFSHRFTSSYGIDIILLTLLIKLITAPLTHKSSVSMKQMQKLQPQMERIKEKFKDDREQLNKEITELYRRNKLNPLGGCLPMLIQFPVFIGLYYALFTPIELRHASFLWVQDLSRPDWQSLPLTIAGWKLGIPILTLLMGASMFAQQWMTPSAGDPNQRRLMLIMPVAFTAMFVTFPAGLTIYWLVNNILSIGQQYLVNRMEH